MDINKYLIKHERDIKFASQSSDGYYFNGGGNCYFVYNSNQEVIWHIDLEFGNVIMYLPEFLDHYNLKFVSREDGSTMPVVEDEEGNQIDDIETYLNTIDPLWQDVHDEILAEYEEF